ncbi:MAG TPA: hypothetical protein VFD90_06250 [Gaiellales bacterium]|jgi:hypothetical protein|nr:hypothetical protein [Gaiellales bacterium]
MTTLNGNARAGKARRTAFALAAAAVTATLAVAFSPTPALAHQRGADVTFTKWVVTPPASSSTLAGVQMTGVVGGDVGRGRYAGEVLDDDTASMPGFWLARARYEFHGHRHFFSADLYITEDDRTPTSITATIQGVVTDGWLKGARVTGEYARFDTCPIPTPGNVFGTVCFKGALHLWRGHRNS